MTADTPGGSRLPLGQLLDLLDEAARLIDDGAVASTETLKCVYREVIHEAIRRLRSVDTPGGDRIAHLVQKWRDRSNETRNGFHQHSERAIAAMRQCADELEAAHSDVGAWARAALLKDRTRRAIRDRHGAGEAIADLAQDYGVPDAFIEALVSWQLGGDHEQS